MEKKTNNNLLIYQKYMDLIYYSNDIVRKYPKSERFALVEEIKHAIYTGLRMLMHAIKTFSVPEKLKYLKELEEVELIKVDKQNIFVYDVLS